jgi:hypothetical protein
MERNEMKDYYGVLLPDVLLGGSSADVNAAWYFLWQRRNSDGRLSGGCGEWAAGTLTCTVVAAMVRSSLGTRKKSEAVGK